MCEEALDTLELAFVEIFLDILLVLALQLRCGALVSDRRNHNRTDNGAAAGHGAGSLSLHGFIINVSSARAVIGEGGGVR